MLIKCIISLTIKLLLLIKFILLISQSRKRKRNISNFKTLLQYGVKNKEKKLKSYENLHYKLEKL